jgi:flagellar hook-associated protein 3 FlgL
MPYRVTNSMMVANYNRNQNSAQFRLNKFQTQLATQRKITRLSEDPVNIVKSLNARSRLYDIEQFRKNIDDAKAWLTQTESAMSEMNEVVKRAYELAIQAANDVNTDNDRTAIANELRELRNHVATLAGSTMGDKFIFGGYNVSSNPFVFGPDIGLEPVFSFDNENMVEVDNTGVLMYNFDGWDIDMSEPLELDDERLQHIAYAINVGQDFEISISGTSLLGFGEWQPGESPGDEDVGKSKNIYLILHEFFTVVNALSEFNVEEGEGREILHQNAQPFIRRLQEYQKSLLAQMSEVGGRMARMELMSDRYAKDEINYTQMKSDVEDLDQAEAIMWFSMAEAVYRASLGVGGRILPPSLMDFMR